jgi:hypothetical protein
MITRHLRARSLDSIWTPKANVWQFGLRGGLHISAPGLATRLLYARGCPALLIVLRQQEKKILSLTGCPKLVLIPGLKTARATAEMLTDASSRSAQAVAKRCGYVPA